MSKAARKQLAEMISESDDGELEFKTTVDELEDRQDVQTVTAESYVWDYCETETTSDGGKVIVGLKDTMGESNARGDDVDNLSKVVALEQAAGLPDGEEKYKGYLDVLEDNDHPLVPDNLHGYFERELEGGVKDTAVVAFDMADPEFYTMLQGHTGTGKNALISKVCAATNRPMVRVNFGLETNKEKIVGMWVPEQEGEGWNWQDGLLTWSARYGGTFVADEFNGAGGEATMPLHGLLEEEGKRFLSIEERGEVIRDLPVKDYEVDNAMDKHGLGVEEKALAAHYARVEKWDEEEHLGQYIHPEFSFVATINPSSYAGTQNMNDATRNRFYQEWIPYMEWSSEKRLLTSRTKLDDDEAENIVKVSNRIRARLAGPRSAIPQATRKKLGMFEDDDGGDIYSPIGTRDLIKIGRKAEMMGARNATKSVLKNTANPEDVNAIEGIIGKVF